MAPTRLLTDGERRALSSGLVGALNDAGASPRIAPEAHPGARIASLWRGSTPILTLGDVIWWPGAGEDFAQPWQSDALATLQHELQHVLDYRTGWLTGARYLAHPRHWSYRWGPQDTRDWDSLGAEQRAVAVEYLWRVENGLAAAADIDALRRLIPWA